MSVWKGITKIMTKYVKDVQLIARPVAVLTNVLLARFRHFNLPLVISEDIRFFRR